MCCGVEKTFHRGRRMSIAEMKQHAIGVSAKSQLHHEHTRETFRNIRRSDLLAPRPSRLTAAISMVKN